MRIDSVKINGLTNPLGFQMEDCVCSWRVSGAKGKRQKFVEIVVSDDMEMDHIVCKKEGKDLQSIGEPLEAVWNPSTRYYVQISVTTDLDETAKSDIACFETAADPENFSASWIGMTPEEDTFHPVFLKNFSLEKDIKSARVSICGLGLFRGFLNGQEMGEDFLAPFINDYPHTVQYCTYDVTELLSKENELKVYLGDGWYRGRFGLGGPNHKDRPLALFCEMEVQYTDGTSQKVCTDETWKYTSTVFELTDIYDGEYQNLLKEESPWEKAPVVDIPAKLVPRYSLPLGEVGRFAVKEVIHTPAGETVLDFGQNFAGYVEIKDVIPKGETLKLEFGEILQDGNFCHANYRTAKSEFTYVSDGKERVIRPWFTYFGFRYVKVTCSVSLDPKNISGVALSSKLERIGWFKSGNKKVNRLYENTIWGQISNFLDIPTDCPQRDERLGWCGDAMVFSRTASYHMDTRAFYARFLQDLRADQVRNDGKIAIYLPNEFPGLTAAVWGDIATFIPHMIYDFFGDKKILEKEYPMMRDWVEYIHTEVEKNHPGVELYNFGFQFGDWLALDGPTEQSRFGRTDSGYVASLYYYASTVYTADAAKALGLTEDEKKYRDRAESIRSAIFEEYYTPTGRLAIDTQTGYLLALRFGVFMDKDKIIAGLKDRIQKDCRKIKGGFVGATGMLTDLAENGMTDIAYEFLLNEDYPGWLYEVNLGATTIWERWNSVLPDGKLSGTEMNSLNHYAYGSAVEFLYRYSAGIRPLELGFRKAMLAPNPDARLGEVECKYTSEAGTYVSNWKILPDGKVSYHFEVPFNAEAELRLPGWTETKHLDAGSYDFIGEEQKNYWCIFSGDTPLRYLLANPKTEEVLKNDIPEYYASINRSDEEAMSKSLQFEVIRRSLFRVPLGNLPKAIEDLEKVQFVLE